VAAGPCRSSVSLEVVRLRDALAARDRAVAILSDQLALLDAAAAPPHGAGDAAAAAAGFACGWGDGGGSAWRDSGWMSRWGSGRGSEWRAGESDGRSSAGSDSRPPSFGAAQAHILRIGGGGGVGEAAHWGGGWEAGGGDGRSSGGGGQRRETAARLAWTLEEELRLGSAARRAAAEAAERGAWEAARCAEETDGRLEEVCNHLRALLPAPSWRCPPGAGEGGGVGVRRRLEPASPAGTVGSAGSRLRRVESEAGRETAGDYTFVDSATMGTVFVF
jgi:hypothetical protein